jgi:hypothetical protein
MKLTVPFTEFLLGCQILII